MNIQKVQNNNSINFKAIHVQKGMDFNLKRKQIAEHIKNELNKINPNDELGRNYVQQAESHDYNIYLTYDKNKNSIDYVRVDIADTLDKQHAKAHGTSLLNKNTTIGVYKSPDEFKIEEFEQIYNHTEKTIKNVSRFINSFIYACVATIACGLGLVAIKDCQNRQGVENIKKQTVEILNDTVKKDSVKPIINMIKK